MLPGHKTRRREIIHSSLENGLSVCDPEWNKNNWYGRWRKYIDEKKKKNNYRIPRGCIRKITKNPLSFYQIFSHLPALISQRRMRFRIRFQVRPYGQVLLIGYTVEKNIIWVNQGNVSESSGIWNKIFFQWLLLNLHISNVNIKYER